MTYLFVIKIQSAIVVLMEMVSTMHDIEKIKNFLNRYKLIYETEYKTPFSKLFRVVKIEQILFKLFDQALILPAK